MSSQVAQDLRAAAEVLRRDGWTQGDMHRKCGHCLIGALEVVFDPHWQSNDEGWDEETNQRYGDALATLRIRIAPSPVLWNDEPGRTADEVIAALEAAADAAEQVTV